MSDIGDAAFVAAPEHYPDPDDADKRWAFLEGAKWAATQLRISPLVAEKAARRIYAMHAGMCVCLPVKGFNPDANWFNPACDFHRFRNRLFEDLGEKFAALSEGKTK